MDHNLDWDVVNKEVNVAYDGFKGKCPNCDSPLTKSIEESTDVRTMDDFHFHKRLVGRIVCSNPNCKFDEKIISRLLTNY